MKFGTHDRYAFDPQSDRLGSSPHSEVFRARDTQIDRDVALKILRGNSEIDPSAKERFEREAKHTGAMVHPNVATIYDFATLNGAEYGSFDGSSYIAMEYLEGRTLDAVLKERTLGYEEGIRVAEQICMALAAVHEHGLIHRDLKPANLMLLPDGTLKLLDFGISRVKGETSLTQEGILVGTVLYMSPEQVRGSDLDQRSDIFSLGAVLYHILTQALPFPGRSFPEVCMAILDGKPAEPSGIRSGFPPALEEFLLTCLAPDPEQRFLTAQQALGSLLEVKHALGKRGRAPVALKGRLFILPVTTASTAAEPLARGVLTDLATSLKRSTDLELARTDTAHVENPRKGDFALRCDLNLNGTKARLQAEVSQYKSGEWQRLHQATDSVDEDDEFALQDQLVGNLARMLRRQLSNLRSPGARVAGPKTSQTHAAVLRAHKVLHLGTSRHLLRAMATFRQVIEHDPSLAIAHAGYAQALVTKFLMFDGDGSFLRQAIESATRAIELDTNCAEAHTSLGFAYQMSNRSTDAHHEWRLAIQLDHSEWLAHRLLGAQYARMGNFAEAISLLQRAIDLKPEHLAAYDHLYSALECAGRYERALVIAERGATAGEEHMARQPEDQDVRLHLALLYARRGSALDARAHADQAREHSPKDGFTLFHLACIHALLKETDEALLHLKSAQSRGYFIQSELHSNTDLDLLRGNPEFQALCGS